MPLPGSSEALTRLLVSLLLAVTLTTACVGVGGDHGRTNQDEPTAPVLDRAPESPGHEAAQDSVGPEVAPSPGEPSLVLRFLDVGQGDAVLIQLPTGQTVLYDGGDRDADLVPRLRALGITALTLVIASHNHADHIGGLPDVIREFQPAYVMENGLPHTTRTYERFLRAIEAAGSQLLEPERRTIRFGEAELQIIPPSGRGNWGQNDNSIGVLVRYGSFRATLLGDAERRQFGAWLSEHPDLLERVHVHKASHHGSRNGDTRAGLRALRPEVVVIGVAADNSYGHPHPEALSLYREVGSTICRTDRDGEVIIEASRSGAYRRVTPGVSIVDACSF